MNPWLERLYKETSSGSVLSPGHLRGQSREHGYEKMGRGNVVVGGQLQGAFLTTRFACFACEYIVRPVDSGRGKHTESMQSLKQLLARFADKTTDDEV
jgi:hypothetical protein